MTKLALFDLTKPIPVEPAFIKEENNEVSLQVGASDSSDPSRLSRNDTGDRHGKTGRRRDHEWPWF